MLCMVLTCCLLVGQESAISVWVEVGVGVGRLAGRSDWTGLDRIGLDCCLRWGRDGLHASVGLRQLHTGLDLELGNGPEVEGSFLQMVPPPRVSAIPRLLHKLLFNYLLIHLLT